MFIRINLYFFIFAILLIGTSCSKRNNSLKNDYTTVSVDVEENSINLSELFDNIEPVYLETNDSSLIGDNPKISFTEKHIFIRSENTIKIFDFEGKFLKSIDKRGEGSGEYNNISDFYINKKLERIEILDKGQKKILNYTYDGEYLGNVSLGFRGTKIVRDAENSLYVYCGYVRDENNIYKINVIDDKDRHSFYEIDEKKSQYLHIMNQIYFHKNNEDDILFFEPFNDTIYTLHSHELKPKYVISYNGRNVPESFYTNNDFSDVFEFFQEYNKHDYVNSTYNVIETDNKLLFSCRKGSEKYFVVYDKTDKTAHSYNRIVDDLFSDGLEIPFQSDEFIFFAENNTTLFLVQPYWLMEHKDKIVSEKLKLILQDLDEEDNPILMVGRMK